MYISPLIIEAPDQLNYKRPWLRFYNENTPANLVYPDKTIYEMLQDTAGTYPDNVALEFMGKKIKYRKLIHEVDNCARALQEIGVTEKDAVTVCMPNTPPRGDYVLRHKPTGSRCQHDPPPICP